MRSFLILCIAFLAAVSAATPRLISKHASVLPHEPVTGKLQSFEHLAQSYIPLNKAYKGLDSNGNNLPVGGDVWPVAIYWAEIEIGTPPVSFPVALDTGSYTTDVPYFQCQGCITNAPNAAYNPAQSSTSSNTDCNSCFGGCVNNTCGFSNSYQTCDLSDPTAVCTITGMLYQDNMNLAGYGPIPFQFGAINSQTTNFDQFLNIDGVMGLAGATSDGNLFAALVDAGKIKNDVFGMCFNEGSTSNGTFTVGGIDPTLYSGTINYTPNTGGSGAGSQYNVQMNTLTVFGQQVTSVSTPNAILDSGTNVLLLPQQPYTDLQTLFQGSCSNNSNLHGICDVPTGQTLFDGVCYDFTQAQLEAYPPITVNLQGVSLTMPWSTYLSTNSPLSPDQGKRCLDIRNTGGSFLIIGDTTMYDYYVVFDRVNNQIGWATKNAKNCGSIPLTHRQL